MDNRKSYYLVFDTETANKKPLNTVNPMNSLVYDFGAAVCDKQGNIYETMDYIVSDIFLDEFAKMQSAYYSRKIPQYIKDLADQKRTLIDFITLIHKVAEIINKWKIKAVIAHNSPFDLGSLQSTAMWLSDDKSSHFFPPVEVWDTMKMANDTICQMPSYKAFCKEYGFMTKNGRVKKTAESLYAFITDTPDFEEKHTGLEDVLIEVKIFSHCIKQHKKMDKLVTVIEPPITPKEWTYEGIAECLEKILEKN